MDRYGNQENSSALRSWVIIWVLAIIFVSWGLFIFLTVGDKGPPSWDFGVVRDIPGESAYSTQRTLAGEESAPKPQHVSQKPLQAPGK